MADISRLEGINSNEVDQFRNANIGTVELFLLEIDRNFNYGIMYMSIRTGIEPERLIALVPFELVPLEVLPNIWIEDLATRVLREAPSDNPWLTRCRLCLQSFGRGLKGNWLGWKHNLPIAVLIVGLLMIVALALRAAGLQALPSPIGLHDRALITSRSIESGRALESGDLYPALLPRERDYFKPDDELEGLVLARSVAAHRPLRFRDVLRPQVIAAKDLQADAVVQKEDVTLTWVPYQPGAALKLEEVYGRKLSRAVRKDAAILTQLIKPTE